MTGDRTGQPKSTVARRRFLAAVGIASTGAFAGCSGKSVSAPVAAKDARDADGISDETHTSPELERWVDEVPRPGVIEPSGTKDGQPRYEVEMAEIEQKLHRDLPPTTLWGYGGQYPGPTIEAEQGEPIYVRWQNHLPDEHLLPEDPTIHGDIIPYDEPGARVVPHLHGGNVEHESDGKPQAWFTRNFERTGPDFKKKDYYYVNDQPPATLWYHDHSLGITRLNVYAGLAGFYLLRNDHERELNLPTGDNEIPLVFQDRSFNEDGSLYYPTDVPDTRDGDDSRPEPSIVPQFYGDVSTVNGKAWPRLSVDPEQYRFRLLNGANSRYYNLKLLEYDEKSGETGDSGPPFVQIGNDGGLLSEPVKTAGRLELGSSQRADVVVDFSEYAGETLLLHNDAPAKYRGTSGIEADDAEPLPEIMLVDVVAGEADRQSDRLPDELTRVPDIPMGSVDTERYLTLARQSDEYGRPLYALGTSNEQMGYELTDPVTETPTLGDTEIWSLANFTGMSHPIHLHLVHFQVLGRQSAAEYDPSEDEIDLDVLDGPESYELGWNDVVTVDPGNVVHVIVHFGEFEGLFSDQTGDYMWHCHMIEHEDHDMMRPFNVLPADGETETD
ncbi:multicopper oxidase family protein [Halorubrum laminariae]|uniref:Multicopper oxidase family protein n=1 Tax=Halorubrum laminariae TaxID=1433523 RepID=A0ABD6BVT4_9EURY|nr:multicopper oxidase [Halorubrum laminariae]